MKAVIQRVKKASVTVEGQVTGSIEKGYLVFLGVMDGDTEAEADLIAQKLAKLRVFSDEEGKMNRSVMDVNGEILVVSQFTLCADCRKGNRPSFTASAPVETAVSLYERFTRNLKELGVKKVATGVFGADMDVSLVNDGPVTIIYDTQEWKKQ